MPRTKRPVKKSEKAYEGGETLKKLDKLALDLKKKIDDCSQMEVRNIELAFKILISSIKPEHLQMTVGQLKNELYLKEITNTRKSRNSVHSALSSHDDGLPSTISRPKSRRSRSADTARKTGQARPARLSRSRSVYKTPAYNKNSTVSFPTITPKVAPHMPLTVLRQPRQGEMVVSMTGSPVMVPTYSSMQPNEKANCNIMLEDGTMLSLQPRQLRQSSAYIPFSLMDSAVLDQLKTLKDNLDKVVQMGEGHIK